MSNGTAMAAKSQNLPHVCVCICTFRRAELLRRLLVRLGELHGRGERFTLSCVVAGNNELGTAADVVAAIAKEGRFEIIYTREAERNFSAVRNRAVQASRGDFIAFIDDDEVPVHEWIVQLLATSDRHECSGVLGPVRPYFDDPPPRWLVKSKICDRPAHPTGLKLNWDQTRSGNVLLRRAIFDPGGIRFDLAYRTGGEDIDFFKRAMAAGHKFVWCEEAAAYELVPPDRMRFAYHVRRALLQGGISLKYGLGKNRFSDRVRVGVKSLIATLIYSIGLLIVWLGGYYPWINCLIKLCHHFGRFTALCGCPIIRERKL